MRWIFFVGMYIVLDIYAYQAFKTITRHTWIYYLYLFLSLGVLGNLLYQWHVQDQVGFWGSRGYAIGFFLAFFVPKLFLFVFLFGEDLIRLIIVAGKKLFSSGESFAMPSRRKFISQIGLGIAALPFVSFLYGMYHGRYNFRVLKYTLYFEDLPKAFHGYRIGQISDIHSGSFDNREKIEYGVDLLNQQDCDLNVFTGDLVNNRAAEMEPWQDIFARVKARDGVFSILGNHDYGDYTDWNSSDEKEENMKNLKLIHKKMGWNLLMNENRLIEKNGERLAIVGVENWGAGGFKKEGDLERAGSGLAKDDFKILLSHDPSHWTEQVKRDTKNYQLTLSGHTHGMQFGIEIPGLFRWSPAQYRYKTWAGIYEEAGRYLNVNRGFGYLAYPGRVGIWPEISVIELKKGARPA